MYVLEGSACRQHKCDVATAERKRNGKRKQNGTGKESTDKLIEKYNKNLHDNLNEEIFKIYEKNNNSEDNTRDNLKEVKVSDEKEGKVGRCENHP